MNTGKK